MLKVIFLGLLTALVTPWLYRIGRRATGWIIALLPLGYTFYFVSLAGQISKGETISASYAWAPSLGVNLSFYVDGLSLLLASSDLYLPILLLMLVGTFTKSAQVPFYF